MSGPVGRVIRGAGKDTAGFGGGGTAPPADMLPLLRLRAQPPPPPARPASASRAWPSRRRSRSADPVRGVRACHSRRGRGHGPSAGRAPPRHVGTGERASALVPARVTRTGAVRSSLKAHSTALQGSSDHLPPLRQRGPTCLSHSTLTARPRPLSPSGQEQKL